MLIRKINEMCNSINNYRKNLEVAEQNHDKSFLNNPTIYMKNSKIHLKAIPDTNKKLRNKSFNKSRTHKNKEKLLKSTIKYYSKNFENLLNLHHTSWMDSYLMPIMSNTLYRDVLSLRQICIPLIFSNLDNFNLIARFPFLYSNIA